MLGGALLFSLTMSLTSCEDILGHWEKPTPNPITPPSGGETPTVEDVIKYGFKVKSLGGVDLTGDATSLKMTKADGTLVAEAEVSAGKITIKNTDLTAASITAAADFWFEATIGTDDKYIAKVNIDPATLSPESDKTLEMATLGDMILDDGTFAASSSAGTKVAMIAYVGSDACEAGDAPYNHGLALALSDVSSSTYTWCSQTEATCLASGHQYDTSTKFNDLAGIANTDALVNNAPAGHTHAAASEARNYNSGTHPDGTSDWFLPSAGQWDKMIGTGGYGLANLKNTANGYTGLSGNNYYWSSSEIAAGGAWRFYSGSGNWPLSNKGLVSLVRACLAF